ncbi:MAG: aminotransferase class V-fold PLP-dependent enzyme [Actinomycetota bacterium]
MSLRFGRTMVVSPGPSIIPDRVLAAMATPMPNMYQGEIVELSNRMFAELPAIARTDGQPFVVIGNGHAAWQMAIANTMSAGDKVLVLESGTFAVAWGNMAALSGVDVEVLPGSERGPVDPEAVQARLAADTDRAIKAVLVVQADTASSVRNDITAIRAAIDAADHPALYMVDCIASLGCDRYEMDAWGVDLTVAACQKGLMVPPGIAFVFAGPRAIAAHASAGLRSGYFDWEARIDPDIHYLLFCGTLPIPHVYGMNTALDMIAEEGGIEAVWARHEALASAVHAAVDTWASPGWIEAVVTDPAHRSDAVTTVLTGRLDANRLAATCEEQMGLVLGKGIGAFDGRAFRIGHMGHLNPPMLLGALGTVETALRSLDVPLGGSGAAAAAEVLAKTVTASVAGAERA